MRERTNEAYSQQKEGNNKDQSRYIEKINKPKSWFLGKKPNKIDKLLARLTKKKERCLINKIRNKRREITMSNTEIQMVKEYYEQLVIWKKFE